MRKRRSWWIVFVLGLNAHSVLRGYEFVGVGLYACVVIFIVVFFSV